MMPVRSLADDIVGICETEIAKRLVAAATYRRIDVVNGTRPMTIEEWIDVETLAIRDANLATPERAVAQRSAMREREAAWRSAGIVPERERVVVSFDAQNRLGVPLRYRATCARVVARDGYESPMTVELGD